MTYFLLLFVCFLRPKDGGVKRSVFYKVTWGSVFEHERGDIMQRAKEPKTREHILGIAGGGWVGGRGRGERWQSIHEEGACEFDVVVGRGKFSAFAVHVGLHVRDAVVRLFPGQILERQTRDKRQREGWVRKPKRKC